DSTFITFGGYENMSFDPKTTYSQQWNLSIQRQIGQDWLVSSNYVGTGIVHLWSGNQINPGIFLGTGACVLGGQSLTACSTTGNVNARRKLNRQNSTQAQYFGTMSQLGDGGTGNYNGLVNGF